MRDEVAVVAGGSHHVWEEIEAAKNLCLEAGRSHVVYGCNDMIEVYPGEMVGVTLHPAKLEMWLKGRAARKAPPIKELWAHHPHKLATHYTNDWGGSVGLFAPRVAILNGYDKILLCGVPMSPSIRHFRRGRLWDQCGVFLKKWHPHLEELRKGTRSFSGWTAEKLGQPTIEFLR